MFECLHSGKMLEALGIEGKHLEAQQDMVREEVILQSPQHQNLSGGVYMRHVTASHWPGGRIFGVGSVACLNETGVPTRTCNAVVLQVDNSM